MKNKTLVLTVIWIGILAVFIVFSTGWASGANRSQAAAESTPTPANPGEPGASSPWKVDFGDEIPPDALALVAQPAAPEALPTAIPGDTLVYFVTTDSDATATVLYLYNTDTVSHTVPLRGFSYNGVLVYSLNINIAAGNFLRLSSDSIAASPPPSWATPAPVITNFTDFIYFASLSLPRGVKVEGYVIFNPGTGTVDPRADQGAIPLRFSTDPATVFLPSLQKAP